MNALNEKLKFYENIEMEKNQVVDHLQQSEKGREELRLTLLDAAEKVKEEQDKNFKYQEILINENQSLSK
jgi:Tfp pilus assembly major pilin PilA